MSGWINVNELKATQKNSVGMTHAFFDILTVGTSFSCILVTFLLPRDAL